MPKKLTRAKIKRNVFAKKNEIIKIGKFIQFIVRQEREDMGKKACNKRCFYDRHRQKMSFAVAFIRQLEKNFLSQTMNKIKGTRKSEMKIMTTITK